MSISAKELAQKLNISAATVSMVLKIKTIQMKEIIVHSFRH